MQFVKEAVAIHSRADFGVTVVTLVGSIPPDGILPLAPVKMRHPFVGNNSEAIQVAQSDRHFRRLLYLSAATFLLCALFYFTFDYVHARLSDTSFLVHCTIEDRHISL